MNFVKSRVREYYLQDTAVENFFINEYMPQAPGDYVKVFLYGLMNAQYGITVKDELMARTLGLSDKTIQKAWNYWEEMGCIRRQYLDAEGNVDFTVEFLSLKEMMYGKSQEAAEPEENEVDTEISGSDQIKEMFEAVEQSLGRSLSTTELTNMLEMVQEEHIPTELIRYGVKYCTHAGKSSLRYITSVIRSWSDKGLHTVDQVDEYLQENDRRHYEYSRILRALGFTRNATEEERRLMDKWLDDLGFDMERILEACNKTAGISNPNFSYVNKVLENWSEEASSRGISVNKKETVTRKTLKEYYAYLRNKEEQEALDRTKEVYNKVPEVKDLDEEQKRLIVQRTQAMINQDENQEKVIAERLEQIHVDKAILMTENGFELNYMDVQYKCDQCEDTGITSEGTPCSCAAQRMEEAEEWLALRRGKTA